MRFVFELLSGFCSVYSIIIIMRIILSWFGGGYDRGFGRVEKLLIGITDPYLNWFRRIRFLRIGFIDFSPVVAIVILSIFNRLFSILAVYGRISTGLLLAIVVELIWSVFSFFLGFCLLILVLKLIAHLGNRSSYGRFWGTIDSLARPIIYKINRILFGGRIINYLTSILVSIVVFIVFWAVGYFVIKFAEIYLMRLPF